MALPHQLAGSVPIAITERPDERRHSRDLADDMPRPGKLRGGEPPCSGLEIGYRHVAERPDSEPLGSGSALGPALGVFPIGERVLHAAIEDEDADGGVDRHCHHLARSAVELERVASLPAADGELIHDSAGNAGKLVLGLLAEERFLHPGKAPATERLHNGRHRHLERRTRAQSGPGREGGTDVGIESRDHEPDPPVALDHPPDVIRPAPRHRRDGRGEVERDRSPVALRPQHGQPVFPRADMDRHMAFDRHRQDEAVVVVGVLADEVHATRRACGKRDGNRLGQARHR